MKIQLPVPGSWRSGSYKLTGVGVVADSSRVSSEPVHQAGTEVSLPENSDWKLFLKKTAIDGKKSMRASDDDDPLCTLPHRLLRLRKNRPHPQADRLLLVAFGQVQAR